MLHERLNEAIKARGLKVADVRALTKEKIKKSRLYAIFGGKVKKISYSDAVVLRKALRLPEKIFSNQKSEKTENSKNSEA